MMTDSEAEFYDPAQFGGMPAPQPEIAAVPEHDSEDEKPLAEVWPDLCARPPDELPQWRVIRRDEVEVQGPRGAKAMSPRCL